MNYEATSLDDIANALEDRAKKYRERASQLGRGLARHNWVSKAEGLEEAIVVLRATTIKVILEPKP
jgi:hypothetical protein